MSQTSWPKAHYKIFAEDGVYYGKNAGFCNAYLEDAGNKAITYVEFLLT